MHPNRQTVLRNRTRLAAIIAFALTSLIATTAPVQAGDWRVSFRSGWSPCNSGYRNTRVYRSHSVHRHYDPYCNDRSRRAYDQGWKEGHCVGFEAGYKAGLHGAPLCSSTPEIGHVNRHYKRGWRSGYRKAYREGYARGCRERRSHRHW